MIAAVLLALQAVAVASAQAPEPPRALTIRVLGGRPVVRVPITERGDGQLVVRADLLVDAIGGSQERLPNGHFSLALPGGAALELTDQSAFATTGADVIPLPAPVIVDGPLLYLPMAIVEDVLPRVATGVLYDPAKEEIRVFAALPPRGERYTDPERRTAGMIPAPVRSRSREPIALPLAVGDTAGVSPAGDILVGEHDEPASPSGSALRRHRLVVVDAGHGGPDHGMMGPIGAASPIYEKNIALAVALKVGSALRRLGMDVLETRTTDTLIALSDRGRMANEHHGDLFLSIHVNAANPTWRDPADARGFETYFLAEAKTEDDRRVERMENEAVRFETRATASGNDPLNFVIKDMAQNENLRESSELAEIIQRRLGQIHPGPDRGVKQAGFRVLVTAYMPAVLIEIGFGTNAAEARYLSTSSAQSRIASAIASATADYLARYERRVNPTAQ